MCACIYSVSFCPNIIHQRTFTTSLCCNLRHSYLNELKSREVRLVYTFASHSAVWQPPMTAYHTPMSPSMSPIRQGSSQQYHPPVMHPPASPHSTAPQQYTSVQPPSVHPRYSASTRDDYWAHPSAHSVGYPQTPPSPSTLTNVQHARPSNFESHRFSSGGVFDSQLSTSYTGGYEVPSGAGSDAVETGSFDSTKYMMKPTYVIPVTLGSLSYAGEQSPVKSPPSLAYQGTEADTGSTGIFGKHYWHASLVGFCIEGV